MIYEVAETILTLVGTIAILAYLGVAGTCLFTTSVARKAKRPKREMIAWVAAAAFFLVLAIVRLTGFEELARDWLRHFMIAEEGYTERRSYQEPLAVMFIVLTGTALIAWIMRPRRAGSSGQKLIGWAWFAMLAFLPLYGLRIISLHATDRLLYGGGLRLNWLIDGGLTLAVALCAIAYIRSSRQKPGRRR